MFEKKHQAMEDAHAAAQKKQVTRHMKKQGAGMTNKGGHVKGGHVTA